jgi:hypothetical protein
MLSGNSYHQSSYIVPPDNRFTMLSNYRRINPKSHGKAMAWRHAIIQSCVHQRSRKSVYCVGTTPASLRRHSCGPDGGRENAAGGGGRESRQRSRLVKKVGSSRPRQHHAACRSRTAQSRPPAAGSLVVPTHARLTHTATPFLCGIFQVPTRHDRFCEYVYTVPSTFPRCGRVLVRPDYPTARKRYGRTKSGR